MTLTEAGLDGFDPIELEILWQSLISTVNEQARALQRSAFSPIVREAGDLANAVFDRRGRMHQAIEIGSHRTDQRVLTQRTHLDTRLSPPFSR